jgi:hypothetical protein
VAYLKDGRVAARDFVHGADLNKGSGPFFNYRVARWKVFNFDAPEQQPLEGAIGLRATLNKPAFFAAQWSSRVQ